MRTDRTAEELEKVGNDIGDISRIICSVVEQMRAEGKETIAIHSKTQIERHVPLLLQWAYKVEADSKLQLRGERDGHHTNGSAKSLSKQETIRRPKK